MSNLTENMTHFELARWYSLIEAVDMIAEECEKRGKSFDNMKISPLDVEKYIEGTCDQFVKEIEKEKYSIQVSKKIRDLSIPVDLHKILQEV